MRLVEQGDRESFKEKDNGDDDTPPPRKKTLRDGGAHSFCVIIILSNNTSSSIAPVREMLVAGGDGLQERKRLLVDKANALGSYCQKAWARGMNCGKWPAPGN
jgi:hypothetical protein